MSGWKGLLALVVILLGATGSLIGWSRIADRRLQQEFGSARNAAVAALEEGDPSRAREALEEIVAKTSSPDAEALLLLATALDREGRPDDALACWERLDAADPGHGHQIEVLAARAGKAFRADDRETARAMFGDVLRDAPASTEAVRARLALFEMDYTDGLIDDARRQGLALVDDPALAEPARRRVEKIVGDINFERLLSREPGPGDELYVVQAGDYIQKIAQRYGLTQELLLRINNISDPKMLSVGHRIKVPKVSFELVVDKAGNTLTVLSNGEFFRRYRCRTGKSDYMTPAGEFKITTKKKDPEWRKPGTGQYIAPGDPTNELGTRWMAFQGSALGIHGTIDPGSIGYNSSQGCVGMLREEVEELFDYIPLGTTVRIVGKLNPALNRPAAAAGA